MAGDGLEQAAATLRAQATLPDLLHTTTRELVDAVDGIACAISRRVGDVLIQVAEHARDGRTLVLGHGYLINDFPLTQQVLDDSVTARCSLLDETCDESEAGLLRELGLDSLLMLPLDFEGGQWGLAEVYVNGRTFDEADVDRAMSLVEVFGEQVGRLPAPAARP